MRCHEPIGVAPVPPPRAAAITTQQLAPSPPRVEVTPAPAPAPAVRRRRSGIVQLVIIALVAGLLVAGGLLGLELFAPRASINVDLVHRSFPELGFSVSRPAAWKETLRRVEGNPGVVFSPAAAQGFSVAVSRTSLVAARTAVGREMRRPPSNTEPIAVTDDLVVDSHDAFRYTFIRDGQYRQQWWVERPGGSFRIEFWAPEYNQRDAGEIAQHIIDTFRLG